MRAFFSTVLITVAGSAATADAQSKILARCGASSGTAYYIEGGAVPPGRGGWVRDGISNGEIVLSVNGQDADILFRDAQGIKSARREGGRVIVAGTNTQRGLFVVLVVYDGAYEHYVFRAGADGTGEVIWGSAKITDLIAKSTLFRATCRF